MSKQAFGGRSQEVCSSVLRDARTAAGLGGDERRSAQYAQVCRWFAENAARLGPGNQLQSPHTATTVRFQGDEEPILRDGPFIEGNEVIGGYSL